jgi:molybdopterin converting factor small subunit
VRKEHLGTLAAEEKNDAPLHPVPQAVSAGEIDQGSKNMKVNVQIVGLNAVYEALRRNEKIEVEFPGKTVRELIDALVEEFGRNVRKALLNEKGGFKVGIRILVNGVIYPVETIMRAILKAGDTLVFKAPS